MSKKTQTIIAGLMIAIPIIFGCVFGGRDLVIGFIVLVLIGYLSIFLGFIWLVRIYE